MSATLQQIRQDEAVAAINRLIDSTSDRLAMCEVLGRLANAAPDAVIEAVRNTLGDPA